MKIHAGYIVHSLLSNNPFVCVIPRLRSQVMLALEGSTLPKLKADRLGNNRRGEGEGEGVLLASRELEERSRGLEERSRGLELEGPSRGLEEPSREPAASVPMAC